MLETARATRGMVTAPHRMAADAGLDVLKAGGNAVEAAVAAAAMIAVCYPHMTGIGGDGFWLVAEPGKEPVGIDASGRAGAAVDLALYAGLDEIPQRGPLAANTVAGAISGWEAVLKRFGGGRSLAMLLDRAIAQAENGTVVPRNYSDLLTLRRSILEHQPGFKAQWMPDGQVPAEGSLLTLPALARTLRLLVRDGLDSFYRGELARKIAADLKAAGSPVTGDDLARHEAVEVKPLSIGLKPAQVFNLPPPTQGLASLIILGLYEALGAPEPEGYDFIHGLVEATKQAFLVRDAQCSDPGDVTVDLQSFLTNDALMEMRARIDRERALSWPQPPAGGDTIWLGVIDGNGLAVSYIQSLYFEFGSGVTLPETGLLWQNRGSSFRLDPGARNRVGPGRKTFHTLNPAFARFRDGRTMTYGTMGGEGQPQTQAAIFARHAYHEVPLQRAISAPRWLLGRTWGETSFTLKLEAGFDARVVDQLRQAGHPIEVFSELSGAMGHAGAIVRRPDGVLEGATDPRSDGGVAGF